MKTASTIFAIAFSLFALESSAARLACWDLFSKKGSRPFITAEILKNDELVQIVINQKGTQLEFYKVGEVASEAIGSPITTKRSPYYGNQGFTLQPFDAVRLILPMDLSSEALKETSFDAGDIPENMKARQNGVLYVSGNYTGSQNGFYIRMHCTSK